MDYKKRNGLRDEIDILIERVCILQDQEKSYKDLSENIDTKKKKLSKLAEEEQDIQKKINGSNKVYRNLKEDINGLQSEKNKLYEGIIETKINRENLNKSYRKQVELIDKLKMGLQDEENRTIKEQKNNIDTIIKEKEKIEENKVKAGYEKKELDNNIEINKNIIEEQLKEIKINKTNIKEINKDFEELNTEYQKLLENYIITT